MRRDLKRQTRVGLNVLFFVQGLVTGALILVGLGLPPVAEYGLLVVGFLASLLELGLIERWLRKKVREREARLPALQEGQKALPE